jgi:hypothetical protein
MQRRRSARADSSGLPQVGLALAALGWLAACAPELHVGALTCSDNDAGAPVPSMSVPVAVPWSTGFENGFCDYTQMAGFCYGDPLATYETVTAPVHSGHHAAAFTVQSNDPSAQQARCVRQGVLPTAAYYGAWYFVPKLATNSALWNLVHLQGSNAPGAVLHGLWDISLVNGSDGSLQVVVFDFLNSMVRRPARPTPIPIGAWFHLELYLKRAADATGEVALYQDGQRLLDATNIITDDSSWGQWYVGNLASGLTPAASTLYVDDVTIRSTR